VPCSQKRTRQRLELSPFSGILFFWKVNAERNSEAIKSRSSICSRSFSSTEQQAFDHVSDGDAPSRRNNGALRPCRSGYRQRRPPILRGGRRHRRSCLCRGRSGGPAGGVRRRAHRGHHARVPAGAAGARAGRARSGDSARGVDGERVHQQHVGVAHGGARWDPCRRAGAHGPGTLRGRPRRRQARPRRTQR
jgi:hypothetical protein